MKAITSLDHYGCCVATTYNAIIEDVENKEATVKRGGETTMKATPLSSTNALVVNTKLLAFAAVTITALTLANIVGHPLLGMFAILLQV